MSAAQGARVNVPWFVDPPWTYSINYANLQGIAPYPAMTLDELKSLPVADVAAPNSLLLLWATNPLLPKALELIEAWGFSFVTVFKCKCCAMVLHMFYCH